MAYSIGRYWIAATRLDGLKILTVLGFVFGKQKHVVEPLRLLDNGELVNGKLIVLWA